MNTFDELRQKYPALIPANAKFECGEGWVGVLDRYFDEVASLLPEGSMFRLDDVRQRYGALTIDTFDPPDASDEIRNALAKAAALADSRSIRSCETCGKPGQMREGSWGFVACDEHAGGTKPVPPEVAVFGGVGDTRYIYDEETDSMVVLTPSRAKAIPWLTD